MVAEWMRQRSLSLSGPGCGAPIICCLTCCPHSTLTDVAAIHFWAQFMYFGQETMASSRLVMHHLVVALYILPLSLGDPDGDIPEPVVAHPFASHVVENIKHITEHLTGFAKMQQDQIGQNEARFHYFRQHDFNSDNKLDGLEILVALHHTSPFDVLSIQHPPSRLAHEREMIEKRTQQKWNDKFIKTVDTALKENDMNNDGYLTYYEYKQAITKQLHSLNQ